MKDKQNNTTIYGDREKIAVKNLFAISEHLMKDSVIDEFDKSQVILTTHDQVKESKQ